MYERSGNVRLFSWNPRTRKFPRPLHRFPSVGPRISNFGDLLGPLIVKRMVAAEGLSTARTQSTRLVTVGSVLHFARPGDVLWGTGRNGKEFALPVLGLDVRALRGPLTRKYMSPPYVGLPEVYGDPGLLVPLLFPELNVRETRHEVSFLPNLNDSSPVVPSGVNVLSAQRPVHEVILEILASRFLVTSSLHGLVIAEAFGVPVRLVLAEREPRFKYEDYYEGTGRQLRRPSRGVAEAIASGPDAPLLFDTAPLIDVFPRDLWRPAGM